MAKLVGVKMGNVVPGRQLVHVPVKFVGQQWGRASLLGEDIGTDNLAGLFSSEQLQEGQYIGVHIYCPCPAGLGDIQVNALVWSIAEISGYGDCVLFKVHVFPLEAQAFSAPDAGIYQQHKHSTPF